jgi:tetratricopeptide (TPR) repeat protein
LHVQRKQYEEGRNELTKAIEAFPEKSKQRAALQSQLARLLLGEGRRDEATLCLMEGQEADPTSSRIVILLAQLALERRDVKALEQWDDKLEELEGPAGTYWRYYRARRLLLQCMLESKSVKDPMFLEAERLQTNIESQRPAWASAHYLRGLILQSQRQDDLAAEAYEEAIRLGGRRIHPRSIDLLVQIKKRKAASLANSDPRLDQAEKNRRLDEAERILDEVRKLAPDDDEARQTAAWLLMVRGGEDNFQKAVGLVKDSELTRGSSDMDQRWNAALLMSHSGRENLEKAEKILDALVAQPSDGIDNDRLLSARVSAALCDVHLANAKAYEALEDRGAANQAGEGLGDSYQEYKRLSKKSQDQYLQLVELPNPNPGHLAMYVDLLIRHDLLKKAESRLEQLDKLAPDNLSVMRIWVRLQKKKLERESAGPPSMEKLAETVKPRIEALAKKLLKEVKGDQKKENGLDLYVGSLYTTAGLHTAAEDRYRRLRERSGTVYGPLAISLARQGRTAEAIEICTKDADDDLRRAAVQLAFVLTLGKVEEKDWQAARQTLEEAEKEHGNNAVLLSALADAYVRQEEPDKALDLYERALDFTRGRPTKNKIIIMNNMASLLADELDQPRKALKLIDEAIELAGPLPYLRDTKGMILIQNNELGEAIRCLESAACTLAPDPRFHFHLAVAYSMSGEEVKADAAYRRACNGDFASRILLKKDREHLADLEKYLGISNTGS